MTHDQEEALALSDRLVVMRDGRIEQSGAPADVYDSPATLWVAGFVGSSNQLAGVVRSVGPQVEIDCDVTRIVADHAHDELRPGDRAVAVVRPDDVALSAPTDGGDHVNRVEALIEDRINVGGQVRAVARTPGGLELVAGTPLRALRRRGVPGARAARRAALGAGRRARVRRRERRRPEPRGCRSRAGGRGTPGLGTIRHRDGAGRPPREG